MGSIGEFMNGVLGILLLGIGASLLITASWSVFALPLEGAVRSAYKAVDSRLPFWIGPLDQVLLCTTVVAITSLITVFPHLGPWATVVERTSNSPGDNVALLGAAAALLALLLFAATQARSAEREARSGGEFYGRPLSTSQFTRSQWAMLLRLPVFQVMTILLFIIPIAITIAPSAPPGQFLGIELPTIPPPDLILSAGWCALFAVVGGVLILNATSSLRSSVLEAIDPLRVQQQIQNDLEDSARRAWTRWATSGRHNWDAGPEEWVNQHISFANDLPLEEQASYVRATVGNSGLRRATWARSDVVDRDLKSAARTAARVRRIMPTRGLARGRRIILGWRSVHRTNRARGRLTAIESAHQSLVVACANAFEGQPLTSEVRRELVRCVQRSAATMDGVHQHLENALERSASSFGAEVIVADAAEGAEPAGEALQAGASSTSEMTEAARAAVSLHSLLLGRERELPSVRSSLPLPWTDDETSPQILTVPALSYRALATALFPRYSPELTSATAGIPLREILTIADSIGHEQTRNYALEQLVSSFMDCVMLHRNDDEPIEVSALEAFVPRHAAPGADRQVSPDSTHRPLSKVIEDSARNALMDNTGLAPERTIALLKLVNPRFHYTALLFDLTYSSASSKRLAAPLLEPFSVALRFQDVSDDAELRDIQELTVRAFRASFASHLISPQAIHWLLNSLRTRVTLELCQQFENAIPTHHRGSFGILQFIQWHLLAGTGFSTSVPGDTSGGRAPAGSMLAHAKKQLWRFCDEWELVDRYSASGLSLFLFEALGGRPDDTIKDL